MATLVRRDKFEADYDQRGDVLYVVRGEPRESESERHPRGVLLRYAADDDAPSGVTVIGYRKNHWDKDIQELARIISGHVGGEAETVAVAVMEATKDA